MLVGDKHSSWISPVVITRRKNGKIHLCLDLRQVNKRIIPVRYPLPNIETLLASIHSTTYITKLDLNAAYHQLLLHPETRELTTFVLPSGVYRFRKAPYGLADLPGSFQRMMDVILAGAPGCLSYLDDIIVWGNTSDEHHHNLRAVLTCLVSHGITLNADKCEYKLPQIEWLGVTISVSGVAMTDVNIRALKDLKEPTSPAELQSVLGTMQYYAKFIPDFASLVAPLRELLRNPTPATYQWSIAHASSFQAVKDHLVTVIAFYRPEAPTFVTCDASKSGLGAVLSQLQGDGTTRPVAFASRGLSAAEQKYSIGELEALACIYAVERWDRYLQGKSFTLFTDHISLVTLLQQPEGSTTRSLRLSRWAARLLRYNFTVQFTKGKKNVVADTLSRMPVDAPSTADIEEEAAIYSILQSELQEPPLTADALAAATVADSVLGQVLQYIQSGWPTRSTLHATVLPCCVLHDVITSDI